jgi:hypothetical protein
MLLKNWRFGVISERIELGKKKKVKPMEKWRAGSKGIAAMARGMGMGVSG